MGGVHLTLCTLFPSKSLAGRGGGYRVGPLLKKNHRLALQRPLELLGSRSRGQPTDGSQDSHQTWVYCTSMMRQALGGCPGIHQGAWLRLPVHSSHSYCHLVGPTHEVEQSPGEVRRIASDVVGSSQETWLGVLSASHTLCDHRHIPGPLFFPSVLQ